jgi:hypothetical protein
VAFATVLGTTLFFSGRVGEATAKVASVPKSSDLIMQKVNGMSLPFTKNEGQWDDRVLYRTSAGGATIWFTREGITYQFSRRIPRVDGDQVKRPSSGLPSAESAIRGRLPLEDDSIEVAVLHANFVDPNPYFTIEA